MGIDDGDYVGKSYVDFHSPEITKEFRGIVEEVLRWDGPCGLIILAKETGALFIDSQPGQKQ
jgi:hypothetical protein